jgi:hypothetical protein
LKSKASGAEREMTEKKRELSRREMEWHNVLQPQCIKVFPEKSRSNLEICGHCKKRRVEAGLLH